MRRRHWFTARVDKDPCQKVRRGGIALLVPLDSVGFETALDA